MNVTHSDIDFTIENFSCWNYETYGNRILLPRRDLGSYFLDPETFMEFYPRGDTGREKHLVVRFCNEWFSGDVEISFIGSDGSSIYTESINVEDYRTEVCTGPEYEKVIARIRENEPYYRDLLTLRIKKKCDHFSRRHVQIAIEVLQTSVKISSEIFKDLRIKKDAWNNISILHYPVDNNTNQRFEFHAFKIDSQSKTNVKFKILPTVFIPVKTLAIVSIFYQKGKGPIVKHQDVERVFTGKCEPITFKSLPIIEDEKRNFYIMLRMKIVAGNAIKSFSHTSLYPCEIKLDCTNSSKIMNTAASLHPDASAEVLRKDLTCLYQDLDFSDLQLRSGLYVFPAHKGILSARSPVFKSMLSSNMCETVSNSVDIEDLDLCAIDRFLEFLYTGKVDHMQWDSAIKLYYAADKYQVPTLKRECVTVLCDEISIANVREILSLAYQHEDEKLTSVAIDFFRKNYNMSINEWVDYFRANPEFFDKTLELMSNRRQSKLSR